MRDKISRLKQNDFAKHNAMFFVGSMAVAAVNYLYYPIVGRMVSTAQFGEVQALISIFTQMSLLLTILANVTVNIIANSTDSTKSDRIVIEFGRFATLVMTVIFFIALIFIQPLKQFLHFESILPIVLVGLSLIVGASALMRSAYLRGHNAYGKLSIVNLVNGIAKLIGSVILINIGYGTAGAIGGLLVGSIIMWVYTYETTKKLGLLSPKNTRWWRLPDISLLKPELSYGALVLVVSLVTTILFSIDVVLAKHYFTPETAGEYAGVATISRIIYYVTGSVAIVLLSAVKLQASAATNRKLFLQSLGLTFLLGGSIMAAFVVAPRFFISLLIGSRYLSLAGLLPKLSLTLFLISIINLLFSYDIALRRRSIAFISVIGMVATAIIMVANHSTPSAMIDSLLIGAISLLVMRGIYSFRGNLLQRQTIS